MHILYICIVIKYKKISFAVSGQQITSRIFAISLASLATCNFPDNMHKVLIILGGDLNRGYEIKLGEYQKNIEAKRFKDPNDP